jgi:GT2 family glycosyltransferase
VTAAVSAILVSYNTRDLLLECVKSLREVTVPVEVVVVDNASEDGSADAVRAHAPEVKLVASPENLGFSKANNLGIRESTAPYVLVLNSDARVRPGAVEAMKSILDERSDVGIVGPRTVSPDGTIQVSFGPDLTPLGELRQMALVIGVKAGRPESVREATEAASFERQPDWVSGSCFLARREALQRVGGFDEAFFLYEEDADLCRRVRQAGYRVVFTPRAEVVHHLGRSMATAGYRAREAYRKSHVRYYEKHNGRFWTAVLKAWIFLQRLRE